MNSHGGSRVGAGRKPTKHFAPKVIDGGMSALAEPPEDVPAAEQAFWRKWARLALEAGSLNERTEAGWRMLCSVEARMRRYEKIIDAEGDTFEKVTIDGAGQEQREIKAHPLVAKHLVLVNKVDLLMARFMLTAFGKPVAPAKATKAVATNPWARIVNQ